MLCKLVFYFLYMLVVAGLKRKPQITGIDIRVKVGSVVTYGNYVCAKL